MINIINKARIDEFNYLTRVRTTQYSNYRKSIRKVSVTTISTIIVIVNLIRLLGLLFINVTIINRLVKINDFTIINKLSLFINDYYYRESFNSQVEISSTRNQYDQYYYTNYNYYLVYYYYRQDERAIIVGFREIYYFYICQYRPIMYIYNYLQR